ncbi:MAG: thiolase family protein, partial [Planctomycetota bacterium]
SAVELGTVAAVEAMRRAGIAPEQVDQTIVGHARQAGNGPNPARQVSIRAGVPQEVSAFTVNIACGSGLKAAQLGAQQIALGDAEVVLAGGMENMTRVPFLLDRMRTGYRLGHAQVVDGMYRDGFHCPMADQVMGRTAETLAETHSIPREEQDRFALESQRKAAAAVAQGAFAGEIVPVGELAADEHPRPDTTLESLARLKPVFKEDGSVTAGNSSGITDGAAALLLVRESVARERKLEPLAFLEDHAAAGVDPKIMGIGPVPATRALLERTRRKIADFDLVELNEAFAAQVLACRRDLGLDLARLNVHGGAIALGHPIGCTGARIVVTLLHAMRRRDVRRGLATLCISGGLGLAASFVRE